MDIAWEDIRIFLAVAEAGSMSGAARRLRVGQPTVSRRLADLEHSLGYALFERHVEGTSLTAQAEELLGPARRMAECAGEVEQRAEQKNVEPEGVVRVTAPPGVAFDFLAPFAAELRQQHPRISLAVMSSVQYLDLARREADLALRTRKAGSGDLMTLHTLTVENAAFATADYAARLPARPTLGDIDWIGWAPPFEGLTPNRELSQIIEDFRPAFASDDYLVQLRALYAGAGAMVLADVPHRFRFQHDLVRLPIDLGPHTTGEIHLVCARAGWHVPRVRLVAEAIGRELVLTAKAATKKTRRQLKKGPSTS